MWRAVAEWILRMTELVEAQRKQQTKISELEKRVHDLEQAVEIMSREARHTREIEAVQRENLILRLENAVKGNPSALPEPQGHGPKSLQ
jgi:predicted  nucleic acid-binding Zn-ribbon protein